MKIKNVHVIVLTVVFLFVGGGGKAFADSVCVVASNSGYYEAEVVPPTYGYYRSNGNLWSYSGSSCNPKYKFSVVTDGDAYSSGALKANIDNSYSANDNCYRHNLTPITVTTTGKYAIWIKGHRNKTSSSSNRVYVYVSNQDSTVIFDSAEYSWEKAIAEVTLSAGEHYINLRPSTYGEDVQVDGYFVTSDLDATPDDSICSEEEEATSINDSATCGDIPLYTQNLQTPAIMMELDISGSMGWGMTGSSDKEMTSVSLAPVIQEMVDQDNWVSGNAMSFRVVDTSPNSDVDRVADSWSSEDSVPRLEIEYTTTNGTSGSVSVTINNSADDMELRGSGINTSSGSLNFSDYNVGLIFRNVGIPPKSEIGSAKLILRNEVSDYDAARIRVQGFMGGNITTISTSMLGGTAGTLTDNDAPLCHTRLDYATAILEEVFQDSDIAWGFGTWDSYETRRNDTRFEVGVKEYTDDHYKNLFDALYGIDANGGTPLYSALVSGDEYYKGYTSGNQTYSRVDEYGESYTNVSCQPKILVVITDGEGNSGTTNSNVITATDRLTSYNSASNTVDSDGVSVVAVGFGIDTQQLQNIASQAQKAGNASITDKVYPLHKEDASGTGVPFIATEPEVFLDAMKEIVSTVKIQQFYGVAPAPTTSVKDEDVYVSATFNPSLWTGDLEARFFDADTGAIGDQKWLASEVFTENAGGVDDALSFNDCTYYDTLTNTVGLYSESDPKYPCKKLGDIINSTPKIASLPPYFYDYDDYKLSFKYNETVSARDSIVYVAANDGALHAFLLDYGEKRYNDAGSLVSDVPLLGTEMWRFYPSTVQGVIGSEICETDWCHEYINDGSPQIVDAYDGTDWRTVLVGGIGRGGAGFYALDITYGESPNATTNPSLFLWEFTSVDDADLGLATALPEIDRVSGNKWVSFIGSGRAVDEDEQDTKYAYLYGLNVFNKQAIWNSSTYKVAIGTPLTSDSPESRRPDDIPSSPLVFDLDDDSYSDHVYVGNRYGDLFRITNIGENDTPSVFRLFVADTDETNGYETGKHPSPIVAKPAFAYGSTDDVWLYFGTGKYEETSDKTTSDQQYFYGIKDTGGASTVQLTGTGLQKQCTAGMKEVGDLTYRTLSCTTDTSLDSGWAVSLYNPTGNNPSERVINQPLVTGGVAFFTTFVPEEDACGGSGDAYLFALDQRTGESVKGIFPDDSNITNDDSIVGFYIGKGVPNQVGMYGDNILVSTTEKSTTLIKVDLKGKNTTLRAWKQVIN